tara:strand:+ start:4487 stop:6835 length:2349 start_codon:yes stop_codon:yes gene_type:complete
MTNTKYKDKTHFIVISQNNENENFIGTNLNIKTYIPNAVNISKNYYEFKDNVYGKPNFSDDKFKNRVILSTKTLDKDGTKNSLTLLTQQNLFHNIKFIQKDNEFNKPRILFIKYNSNNNIITDNSNQYLFKDLGKVKLNEDELNMINEELDIETLTDYKNLKSLVYYFNIYKPFVNSDYYKFKFSDFSFNKYLNNSEIKVKNIILNNTFASNNLINYNENNFKKLFYFYNDITTYESPLDVSQIYLNEVPFNFNNNNQDNFLIYNKLNNISTIQCTINSTDININFIVQASYDYKSKYYGKIYLTSNFTYLNSRVLGYNNRNFYDNHKINDNDEKMIYLSLGNSITGITQKDLYTKMKLDINTESNTETEFLVNNKINKLENISKIYFSNSVNSTNVINSIKNRQYLLEEDYNYDYTNILYNNIQETTQKYVSYELTDFYHNMTSDFSYNIYKERFNSLELISDDLSSVYIDKNYINTNNEFTINYTDKPESNSNITVKNESINKLIFDFRNNYNTTFDINIFLNIEYKLGNDLIFNKDKDKVDDNKWNILKNILLKETNNSFSLIPLNFYKIILTSNFTTTIEGEFPNIKCIHIYYDPYNDNTPEQYKYPYNNIEISDNIIFDNLSKAIELMPNSTTSVTNTSFIPDKNGSNLSKKQIEGLIGLNNIPKLLSILPYDEDSILGRGFINQYQIENECKTDVEKVEDKLNSQKHISVKNPLDNNLNTNKIPRTRNFANIVRNRKRNQIKQNQDLPRYKICSTDASTIQNYTTPFTNPMWKRSK